MRQRPRRPEIESLEGRAMLSEMAHGAALPAAYVSASRVSTLALSGTVRGLSPDPLGHQVLTLSGIGQVRPLGRVTLSGSVDPTGTIFSGRPPGVIQLTNGRRSVTLDLYGPTPILPTAPGIPMTSFRFHFIISGAGRTTGAGTAVLTYDEAGNFSLRLRPGR